MRVNDCIVLTRPDKSKLVIGYVSLPVEHRIQQ